MSEKYIILAQSPNGNIGVYAASDERPTVAVIFNGMEEVRHEIGDSVLLQGLPIQIVKLDMAYFEED